MSLATTAGMRERTIDRLNRQLRDERGGRVALVSRCLLDQNLRYPGGAACPGAYPPVVRRCLEEDLGIEQMPCPEQRAWGGIARRLTLPAYRPRTARLAALLVPLLVAWTRIRYAWLARRVARDIADHVACGGRLELVLGVAGSPSCGVATTLDLRRAAAALARGPELDRATMNRDVVGASRVAGEGLFIAALRRALRRRGIEARFDEVELPVGPPARPSRRCDLGKGAPSGGSGAQPGRWAAR
jgi:hypothetical protein